MSEKNNLQFWDSVEKTDPKHTKKAKVGGREITAISAQYQIKNATAKFGKYGETWGLKNIKLSYLENLVNDQILSVCNAVFYYPDGEFEIGSSILVQSWIASRSYNKVDPDFLKKIETDLLTKSLSKLGFNADVFMGRYDDNKYIMDMNIEFGNVKPPEPPKKKEPKKTEPKKKLTEEAFKSLVESKNKEHILAALKFREMNQTQRDTLNKLLSE